MGDLAGLIRSEREGLLAFLVTLTPEQWATPSLCDGWTVQDVAAHLAFASALPPLATARGMARAGFRVNRFIGDSARHWALRGTTAILDQLRADADQGLRPFGPPEVAALCDAMTHGVDIRRPLGSTAPMSPAVFPVVADFLVGLRWPLTIPIRGDARAATRGVRLRADDVDWVHGDGPEVHGPAEVLVRLLAGRRVGSGELAGPGVPDVLARLR